jgi:hypothetical protein
MKPTLFISALAAVATLSTVTVAQEGGGSYAQAVGLAATAPADHFTGNDLSYRNGPARNRRMGASSGR